jgi:cysteine desulfurase/selenocysteine lyase
VTLDAEVVRGDFPVLSRGDRDGPPIVYLDSACMSLRPRQVVEAVRGYYEEHSACAGRSIHGLATEVSRRLERSRRAVAELIGANRPEEVVFVQNTTAGLDLLSRGLALGRGDAVVLSDREHNSNLVPWLHLRESMGASVRAVPSERDGTFDTDRLHEALAPGDVKVVSFAHVSNLDGYQYPLREIAQIAHDRGAVVIADAAQSVPHVPVDVDDLGVDFLVFSGHKMLGPTGAGVLWGRYDHLEGLDAVGGGGTVASVSYDGYERLPPPRSLEAGTHNLAGIYGLEAAVRYLQGLDLYDVHAHDVALNRRATEALEGFAGVRILGPRGAETRGSVLSFVADGLNAHEVGMALDEVGNVAVRTGMHCNHVWFSSRGIDGAVRASFYVYNTPEDVDVFVSTLEDVLGALRV